MKKFILIVLVFLISLNFVNAELFATLAMQGLSFAGKDGKATAELVSNVICAASPVECLVKKGTNLVNQETLGKLKQEMYSQVQKNLDPKIFEALNTAKQIQGQIGQAGQILKELQMDENGGITSGSIEVGKGDEKKTITFVGGIKPEHNEETKTTRYTFAESGGKIDIKQGPYTNTYTNIKSPTETSECTDVCFSSRKSYIDVDEKGNILQASFETSGPSEFVFGNQWIKVPKNTRINYDGNQIRLDGKKGEQLKDVGFLNNFDPSKSEDLKKNYPNYNIDYSGIGQVTFTNEGVEIFSGVTITDTKLKYSVTNTVELGASNVFITDNIRNKGSYSNVVIANEAGLSFMGSDYDIKLNQGNKWVKGIVDGKNNLILRMSKETNSIGSLSNNHLEIGGGKIELVNSVEGIPEKDLCTKVYTAKEVYEDYGNAQCFNGITVSSKNYNNPNFKDGSSELCLWGTETTPTEYSIFDVLTGRFILWVTGMQAAPEKGCTVAMNEQYYSLNKEVSSDMCPGNLGTQDNKHCKYTPAEIIILSRFCDTAKTNVAKYPLASNVIENKDIVCNAYAELSGKELKKESTTLSPTPKRNLYSSTQEQPTQVAAVPAKNENTPYNDCIINTCNTDLKTCKSNKGVQEQGTCYTTYNSCQNTCALKL